MALLPAPKRSYCAVLGHRATHSIYGQGRDPWCWRIFGFLLIVHLPRAMASLPSPTLMNVTTRVPIGPVGANMLWNTPFMLSTWKIAPALAAGCTVVHKPAELSPVTASILMEIAKDAGLPDGVWNLVNGIGEEAGKFCANTQTSGDGICRRKPYGQPNHETGCRYVKAFTLNWG